MAVSTESKNYKKPLIIILTVLLLLGLSYSFYFLLSRIHTYKDNINGLNLEVTNLKQNATASTNTINELKAKSVFPQTENSNPDLANTKLFSDTKSGVSFRYPADWQISACVGGECPVNELGRFSVIPPASSNFRDAVGVVISNSCLEAGVNFCVYGDMKKELINELETRQYLTNGIYNIQVSVKDYTKSPWNPFGFMGTKVNRVFFFKDKVVSVSIGLATPADAKAPETSAVKTLDLVSQTLQVK